MEKIIFIIEHKTWSSNSIVEVHEDDKIARDRADYLESHKHGSDGYIEYYVRKVILIPAPATEEERKELITREESLYNLHPRRVT